MKVFFSACLFLFSGGANGLRFAQERTHPESETSSNPTDFAEEDLNDIQVFIHEQAHPEFGTSSNPTDFAEEDLNDIQEALSLLARASKPYQEFFHEFEKNISGLDFSVQDIGKDDYHLPPTLPRRAKSMREKKLSGMGGEEEEEFEEEEEEDAQEQCQADMQEVIGANNYNTAFNCPSAFPADAVAVCKCGSPTYFAANQAGACSAYSNVDEARADKNVSFEMNSTWCGENTDKMTWCTITDPSTYSFCTLTDYCPCMKKDNNPGECRQREDCVYMCEGCYGAAELLNMGISELCVEAMVNMDSVTCIMAVEQFGGSWKNVPEVVRKGVAAGLKQEMKLPGIKKLGDSASKKQRKNARRLGGLMKRMRRGRLSKR